jgi:hypothetical protein
MYQAYIDCVNGKPVLIKSFEDYQNQHPKTATVPIQKEGKYLKIPKVKLSNNGSINSQLRERSSTAFRHLERKNILLRLPKHKSQFI